MKVAVVGAGVVGITTAHALVLSGHEVTVFERSIAAAEGASFANAGMLSPSLSNALAHPQWPSERWLHRFGAIEHIDASATARVRHGRWHSRWKHPSRTDPFVSNLRAARDLVSLSRDIVLKLETDPHLAHESAESCLVLLPPKGKSIDLQRKLDFLKEQQVKFSFLTSGEVRLHEPALNSEIGLEGAIHFPEDSAHNCRHFALQLRSKVLKAGGAFKFNHEVTGLTGGVSPSLVMQGGASMPFDHIVVCTGFMPHPIATSLNIHLPTTPITGYSLSAPLREPTYAPQGTVIDLANGLTIGRMGNRIRVAGGYTLGIDQSGASTQAAKRLFNALQHYYPGAAQATSGTQFWGGTVASLPDGLPAIGPSGLAGIWLNMAHGTNGWGMACGSAELINAMISRQSAPLDPAPFDPCRF